MTLFEKAGAVLSTACVLITAQVAANVPLDNGMQSPLEEMNRQFECLAKNIYFEARSESELAQRAVGWVTLNRVNDSRYPGSICEVVHQGRQDAAGNMIRHKCQFSWYCDGKSDEPTEIAEWHDAMRVAFMVIGNYGNFPDPVEGAFMYHADYVDPHWSDSYARVTRIDSHIFYKDK